MFEKVNPSHPDKLADRIAGALVDFAYAKQDAPRIAAEVLLGHGTCNIIVESSVVIGIDDVGSVVDRIAGCGLAINYQCVPQDVRLAGNQDGSVRCGDNGIFRGVPMTPEQIGLSSFMRELYSRYPFDGKSIVNDGQLFLCQSNVDADELTEFAQTRFDMSLINPLGYWTGGVNVDSGATNRKLGSDMADSITGGGLHGKDLSKADVSVNIYAWLKAQETGRVIELCCAIGDEEVDGVPYSEIVDIAHDYIMKVGGFEKFAEWGLV